MDLLAPTAQLFVFTRFNVRLYADRPAASDTWLRSRIEIFERLAYASMKSQSVAPAAWFVFFDGPSSPSWLRERVGSLASSWGVLAPVWVEGPFDAAKLAVELVQARVTSGRVVTVRLDNDDAIAVDFIERLDTAAVLSGAAFLNFTVGLQFEAGRLYRRADPSNAFLALSEPVNTMVSVFVVGHHEARTYAEVHQLSGGPMWLVGVDGSNLGNVIRGIRTPPSALNSFCVQLPIDDISGWQLRRTQILDVVTLLPRVLRSPRRIKWAFKVASVFQRIRR